MPTGYAAALEALFRAPHGDFVGERARLAAELTKAGDAAGGKKLAKVRRPSITAWAVNQLWWSERATFKDFLRSAERLRDADLSATDAHRKAQSKLRERATALLAGAGHAATEGTLRRVTATLSALAATGSFAPDEPGTLRFDRDPPGFGAVNPRALEKLARRPQPKASAAKTKDAGPTKTELAAEKRRLERDLAVQKAERDRVDASVRTTRATLDKQELELRALRTEVEERSRTLGETKQKLRDLEKRRRTLGD
jgi:hypothetical protein